MLSFCLTSQAQTDEDKNAVKQAALDYIEAVYNVNPAQAERSVHTELVKRGFFIE